MGKKVIQENIKIAYTPPKNARVISVIETCLQTRGSGKDKNDPIRTIIQYYSLDGELLAEVDSFLK